MYNQYIPDEGIFSRIPEHEAHHHTDQQHGEHHHKAHSKKSFFQFFKQEGKEKNAGLSGILKRFKLDDIDTGDILLFLILIFAILEDENWELAIILGLVLFLSFRDDDAV